MTANDPANVCASSETVARIKAAVFEKAAAAAPSTSRYALPKLQPATTAVLSRPLVESFDPATRRTNCSGVLVLDPPVGVLTTAALRTTIRYSAQPLADGSGVSFDLAGADGLAASLAGADLTEWSRNNAPSEPGLVVEYAPGASPAEREAHVVRVGPGVKPAMVAEAPRAPSLSAGPTSRPQAPRPAVASAAPPTPAPVEEGQPTARPSPPTVASVPPTPHSGMVKRARTAGTFAEAGPRRAAPPPAQVRPAPIVVADARRKPIRSPLSPPPARSPAEPPLAAPWAAGGDGPVRVFVHIADPARRGEAEALRDRLASLTVQGAPVAAPAIRMVARTPRRNEVRCLKAADCAAARRIAAYLARSLPGGVAVVDMSRTYGTDPGVRRGSLELWLAPTSGSGPRKEPPFSPDEDEGAG